MSMAETSNDTEELSHKDAVNEIGGSASGEKVENNAPNFEQSSELAQTKDPFTKPLKSG